MSRTQNQAFCKAPPLKMDLAASRRQPLYFLPMVSVSLTPRPRNTTQQTGASLHVYSEFIFLHAKRPQGKETENARADPQGMSWSQRFVNSIVSHLLSGVRNDTLRCPRPSSHGIARPANCRGEFSKWPVSHFLTEVKAVLQT